MVVVANELRLGVKTWQQKLRLWRTPASSLNFNHFAMIRENIIAAAKALSIAAAVVVIVKVVVTFFGMVFLGTDFGPTWGHPITIALSFFGAVFALAYIYCGDD